MSWTQRGILAVVVVLGALIVMDRTRGSGKPGEPRGDSPIKGATYASAIPVYPGAKLADIMGGEYRDAVDGPAVYTSQSWFFDITDSVATVAEFYRKNLPQGWRPKEADAGEKQQGRAHAEYRVAVCQRPGDPGPRSRNGG